MIYDSCSTLKIIDFHAKIWTSFQIIKSLRSSEPFNSHQQFWLPLREQGGDLIIGVRPSKITVSGLFFRLPIKILE